MFLPFFYQLRDQGVPISLRHVLEFYQAMEKGLAPDLDRLFILMRLIFVKKVEHFDGFEQAFAAYFLGAEGGEIPKFSHQAWEEKDFRRWLEEEMAKGSLPEDALERLSLPELLQRFWDVVMEQRGKHQGGHTWVGTGGTSAFGHSGADREGIRVHGDSLHGSALKVIESRRYVDYATSATLRAENLRQVLAALKHMAPAGPLTELDVDETIDRSCRNGGEIELVFKRELRDRIQVIVLLDNGGASMRPYLDLVKLVFGLMRDHFKDLDYYYFHNCMYEKVWKNNKRRHTEHIPTAQLINTYGPDWKLIYVGDATMSPYEIVYPGGSVEHWNEEAGQVWMERLLDHFSKSVWLNPVPERHWEYTPSLQLLKQIMAHRMFPLTLQGLDDGMRELNR